MDVEQLYLHGFQFVGHANTNPDANCHTDTHSGPDCHTDDDSDCDTNTNCGCYTNTHPDSYTYYTVRSDVEPAAGFDFSFFQCDLQLERGQRDGLLPFSG